MKINKTISNLVSETYKTYETKQAKPWRVLKLLNFLRNTKPELSNVKIVLNNTWSRPPKPSGLKNWTLLGGTTYRYQVWAVEVKS